MTSTAAVLEQVTGLLAGVCAADELGAQFDGASAAELVGLLLTAGEVQRRLDAVITTAVGEVVDRDCRLSDERVSPGVGCRDVTELLRRALRVDTGTARRYATAAHAVRRSRTLSGGELLPARYDALGHALRDGVVSVTGLLAATVPLVGAGNRIGAADRAAADRLLADAARGVDLADEQGRPGPVPSTGELAALAEHIVLRLDPDGKEPVDDRANRNRGLTLGRQRGGIIPIRGGLLPDVAAQFQRLLDALLNPRVDGPEHPEVPDPMSDSAGSGPTGGGEAGSRVVFTAEDDDEPGLPDRSDPEGLPDPPDPRTPAQKRHDAFASILTTAAAQGGFPTLGGAAPTLVVSVTAEAYTAGTGRACVEGTGWDVPLSVAHQTACAGGVQRVLFDPHGKIIAIGTTARIFTALQRRAIILRDRECVIPGCTIPATWCEIHHVTPHAHGGPTHTSNGVALCWHHHRTLDTSGWHIRMQHGTPQIRGPACWDPHSGWHRPRTHGGTHRALRAAPQRAGGP